MLFLRNGVAPENDVALSYLQPSMSIAERSCKRARSKGEAMSLANSRFAYSRGLHDLGNGGYAWLQPDGGWGWSNAGLVVSGDHSLLVDTLFDVPLTRDMLDAMRRAEPKAAAKIDTVVNTHHNGDHWFGNQCCEGAEIIAHKLALEGMLREGPEMLAALMKAAPGMGETGQFFTQCFGAFDFAGVTATLPTTTFEGELTRQVGDKTLRLTHVGPAHTPGDILVHAVEDKVVFTGDILFIEGHPIMWAGPIRNWVAACDRILAMDVETVVPGHGPITDKKGVAAVRDYLVYTRDEAKKRFDAGLSVYEAASDIDMRGYEGWGDGERVVANVTALYREFAGEEGGHTGSDVWGKMAQFAHEHSHS